MINRPLIIILTVVFGAVIAGGAVYFILNKEVNEWQLVVAVLEDRLAGLRKE